jgi:serine-type D-Ala-D-Ala carboxypeptidase (penicillin-binding protein 5/6)
VTVGVDTPPAGWPEPPSISARAAVLVDADSGQVLAAVDHLSPHPVASTVKTLTALTVLRRAELDDRVTAGEEVTGLPLVAAHVGLEPGDTWTVEELLAGLIARSGNDAAMALATAVGGSTEGFLELMRTDVADLGVVDAEIETPHGLGDLDRLSAHALATIARAAMADERFVDIAARSSVTLPGLGSIPSRNDLLASYRGADGVKTGYTIPAGRTLIASAARDDRRLVAVVLGSSDPDGHFRDAAALLDHGFERFAAVPVGGSLEVRVAGGWVPYGAPRAEVLAPSEPGVALEVEVDVPIEAGGDAHVVARWLDDPVLQQSLAAEIPAAPPDTVGGWLTDRTYAAMRAATAAESWP